MQQNQAEKQLQVLREKAYKLLGIRAHSTHELGQKLKRRYRAGQPLVQDQYVQQVVRELLEANYLNDREFAEQYIRSVQRTRPLARRGVQYKLMQKGVSQDIIQEVLEVEYPPEQEEMYARSIVQKLVKKHATSSKTKDEITQSIGRALQSKGFHTSTILDVLQ